MPGVALAPSKNVSSFGPAVYPAIGNIYTNVLFYSIDNNYTNNYNNDTNIDNDTNKNISN